MNKEMLIVIAIILIGGSFFIGWSVKPSTSGNLESLQNQVNDLKLENNQMKSQIQDLQSQLDNSGSDTDTQVIKECEDNGGKWSVSFGGVEYCNLPTSDGGTPCNDNDQCESKCVPPKNASYGDSVTGSCLSWEKSECFYTWENGIYIVKACA